MGRDTQEMLDDMNSVVNLAAAAGEGLAQVSDSVMDNLSAFGLAASDAAGALGYSWKLLRESEYGNPGKYTIHDNPERLKGGIK